MSFRLFPLIRWFVYGWRNLNKFFSNFCWNLFQLSTRIASTCGYCSVSVSFLNSILFIGLSLFYVVSLSFKRQTFSFTACSTSLPDSLLFLFNFPLNVNHSKKDQLFFILMVQTEKLFFNKTVAKLTTFISVSLLLSTKWYLFCTSFFLTYLRCSYPKTQNQLRHFAELSKNFENKNFGLGSFSFVFKELLQLSREPYKFDIIRYCLS